MVKITVAKPGRKQETLTFLQPAELTIGRSAGCSVCLDFDPMVSRMHAVFLIEPPKIRIKDLNSTNGLTINGHFYGGFSSEKLVQPHELGEGDEIIIGCTLFRISGVGVAGTSEPASLVDPYQDKTTVIKATDGEIDETMGAVAGDKTIVNIESMFPIIPGYQIRGFIGEGRAGNVYYGVSEDDGQQVAIKVVTTELPFTNKMLEDFNQEVAKGKNLLHPHIVRLHGSGAIDRNTLFLAMEYVNGEDLASYLTRCPKHRIPLGTAYKLMLHIGEAMCYAHSHSVLHRDITPKSIILYDDNGKVGAKVLDMGLVRCLEYSGIHYPHSGEYSAMSLRYTAPEVLTEAREAKASADVFSLAAVYYEILAGCTPYDLPNDDASDNYAAAASARIVPIEERIHDLPEPLVVILDRALSADPDERYQNCCNFLEALENVRV